MKIAKVVIVDDHQMVLRGVTEMIADAPDFEVVATALDAKQALVEVEAHTPDLVLLDLRLKDQRATDLLGPLRELAPKARIAILTAFTDETAVLECLALGADGVLLKDASSLDLARALRAILAGTKVVDPRFSTQPRADYAEGGFERLSDREMDVIRLLSLGHSTREMATELGLMPNTIRSYTQAILEKLQAHNRVMALATARRLGII